MLWNNGIFVEKKILAGNAVQCFAKTSLRSVVPHAEYDAKRWRNYGEKDRVDGGDHFPQVFSIK